MLLLSCTNLIVHLFALVHLSLLILPILCYPSIPLEIIKKALKRKGLMLPRGVFNETRTKLISGFWSSPSPLYAHVHFRTTISPLLQCVHKSLFSTPSPQHTHTHTQTHYHHLTNNVFKYLSIKRYQALNRLKNNTKQ